MSNIENIGNIENTDRNTIFDLSNYGKAMKFYAIAKLIWTVFSFVLLFVLGSSILGLLDLTEAEMIESAGSIMLLFAFVVVGGIGGGIFIIVRYIIFLLKLNKASNSSTGAALRTNFYIEMGVLTGYIINAFLVIPTKIYVDLIIFSLLIASTIYLGKWVNTLSNQRIDENQKRQTLFWIRFMTFGIIVKFGEIIRLFSSAPIGSIGPLDNVGMILFYIGDVILIVGMIKTANEIMSIFNTRADPQSQYTTAMRNRGPVQRPQPEKSINQEQTYPSRIQSPEPKGLCPYCGSSIVDPNTMFCSVCGKKIN